jgi:hypothetical protein
MGWEGQRIARIMARTPDVSTTIRTAYRLLPELIQVPFGRIPTEEDRFALPRPTYLALDSAAAWVQWFGEKPPVADPRVDWQQEFVLGAFLGPQPEGVQVEVASVVQRNTTVSVWLTTAVPEGLTPAQDTKNLPRVLVRIPRRSLSDLGRDISTPLVFAFLDADGRLLAQGPASAVEPVPSPLMPQVDAFEAPQPEAAVEPSPEAVAPEAEAAKEAPPEMEASPEAAPPEIRALPQPAPTEEPAMPVLPPVQEAPPARTALAWLGLALWVVLVVALAIGLFVFVGRYIRRH